jgi:hypothetical protein
MKPAKEGKNVTLSEARAVFREIKRAQEVESARRKSPKTVSNAG